MELRTVEPNRRIKALCDFYTHVSISISQPELKGDKKLSDEAKGRWLVDRLKLLARDMNILQFMIPLEQGGIEIPRLAEKEAYELAYVKVKKSSIIDKEASFSGMVEYVDELKEILKEAKMDYKVAFDLVEDHYNTNEEEVLRRGTFSVNDEDETNSKEDTGDSESTTALADAEWRETGNELRENLKRAKVAKNAAYDKWMNISMKIQHEKDKVEAMRAKCIEAANKQYNEDVDALNALRNTLKKLQKTIIEMLKKLPNEVGAAVTKRRADMKDPLEEGDMRAVYTNLLNRYKKSDSMGISTTLMAGMAERQTELQSPEEWARYTQDFYDGLKSLGVLTVTLEDLVAMISIVGMREVYRKEYLQQQANITLARNSFMADDCEFDTDDGDTSSAITVMSRRTARMSLLDSVFAYCESHAELKVKNETLARLQPSNTV